MALTGNTVASTYLDLVQLEQSGSGLQSHAGKNAALHDGSGAQIIGRTAQRNWLDPDPDAIASNTWEWSTYGDADQTALEAAGWTFTNCTAEATGGNLEITKTSAYNTAAKAEIVVSLAGDFDFILGINDFVIDTRQRVGVLGHGWGFAIADSTGSANGIWAGYSAGAYAAEGYKGSTYANLASGTAWSLPTVNSQVFYLRIMRISGVVWFGYGTKVCKLLDENGNKSMSYAWRSTSQADASTFDRLILTGSPSGKEYPSGVRAYPFLRRYE